LPAAAARRQEIAVTIDDGPDPEVTPKVLDILDCFGVKATFFCIGAKVREFSELCAEIRGRGHEVENHTQTHSHRFSLLGPSGYRREIEQAQDTIERVAGRRPVFFRAPAGLRNPFLEPVLCSLGLQLASWTRRGFDTLERDVDVVGRRLLSNLATGDILLLHDGHAARTAHGQAVVLEVLPRLLVLARDRGLKPVTLRQAMQ